jgi:hypothetical protein
MWEWLGNGTITQPYPYDSLCQPNQSWTHSILVSAQPKPNQHFHSPKSNWTQCKPTGWNHLLKCAENHLFYKRQPYVSSIRYKTLSYSVMATSWQNEACMDSKCIERGNGITAFGRGVFSPCGAARSEDWSFVNEHAWEAGTNLISRVWTMG